MARPPVGKFKTLQVPRQQGELARFRILRGPDKGSTFVLFEARATVGRGEDSTVTIADLKASRLHAEIQQLQGAWQVRDLGSANGVLINGKQSRNSVLRSGDLLTVGETVLEFLGPEQGTMFLAAPAQSESQLEKQAADRRDAKKRARSLVDPFGMHSGHQGPAAGVPAKGGLPKAARLGLVAVAGVVVMVLLESGGKEPRKRQGGKRDPGSSVISQQGSNDLASLLPRLEPSPPNKTAEMFFRQGFREFRARNFIRARTQFELVLQIVPDHEMALRYRDNCAREIELEVGVLMQQGRRNLEAGKFRESRGQYETVVRLLSGDQSNPSFQEAQKQLEKIKGELGKVD